MSERRLVPRTDMLFYPLAKLSDGEDAGRVMDINHIGLSIVGSVEFPSKDSFTLFVEEDHHEELIGKKLILLVEVIRCKKLPSGHFDTGFRILANKSPDGDVLLNKMIRILGLT